MGHPLFFAMVIPVTRVGERAKCLLEARPRWEVLGRTSQAVYLFTNGEVLWVTRLEGELHCRAILAQRLPYWTPGSTVFIEGYELRAEEECVSLKGAEIWTTPALPCPKGCFRPLARALLKDLSSLFPSVRAALGDEWWELCRQALSRADVPYFLALAKEKVGCGPGLTPLADDFLGGALFALRVLAPQPTWAKEVEDFLVLAEPRTHRLSFCLLTDLSRGQGPAALHALAEAIFSGKESLVWRSFQGILRLGHSTGAALLSGALLVWSEFGERGERWRI